MTLEGDRQGPGAHAHRRRSAPHRDRRARRHPPRRCGPGTDAWLLAAILGVLVEEDLVDHAFLAAHADRRSSRWSRRCGRCRSPRRCARAGLDEALVRRAARVIGRRAGARELRGPRRADEPRLDAGELPAPPARPRSPAASASRARTTSRRRSSPFASGASKHDEPGRRRAASSAAWCRATSSPTRSSPTTRSATAR